VNDLDHSFDLRVEARLQIVDALLWASEHPEVLIALVRAQETVRASIERLTQPPYDFTEAQAHHLLDLPMRQLSPDCVALLREEEQRLRASVYQPPVVSPPIIARVVKPE
jgi:DNA gyrase/topoisomerase IV subunit A